MTSISEIAQDPRKALKKLEKELRVREGTLMREMQEHADGIGDWTEHIPYNLAVGYYESSTTRQRYASHVDRCRYCQRLLESLHPTDLQASAFLREAVRTRPLGHTRRKPGYPIAGAVAASVIVTALASLLAVPKLQSLGVLHTPADSQSAQTSEQTLSPFTDALTDELRKQPNRLTELQASREPTERFLAAKYYFAANAPELAYRQIGAGLQLSGLHAADASKITTVADRPSDAGAAATDLSEAAQQLPRLEATARTDDPTDFLDIARAQARLGRHQQALISIQRYLQAEHVDPKMLADFSTVRTATLSAVVPDNELSKTELTESDTPP